MIKVGWEKTVSEWKLGSFEKKTTLKYVFAKFIEHNLQLKEKRKGNENSTFCFALHIHGPNSSRIKFNLIMTKVIMQGKFFALYSAYILRPVLSGRNL